MAKELKDAHGNLISIGSVTASMVLAEAAQVAQTHSDVMMPSIFLLDLINSKNFVWGERWIAERALAIIESTPQVTVAQAKDMARQEFFAK